MCSFFLKGIFKDKSKYPTLTRMSYCQCRLRLVFSSVFKEFGWSHVALILDRSDLFSLTVGKNLEYGLRKEGLLKFVRDLDGNSEDESYHLYLRDASMYARSKCNPACLAFTGCLASGAIMTGRSETRTMPLPGRLMRLY